MDVKAITNYQPPFFICKNNTYYFYDYYSLIGKKLNKSKNFKEVKKSSHLFITNQNNKSKSGT